MMRPTDEDLNRAIAEIVWGCSHTDMQRDAHGIISCRKCGITFEKYPFAPKYCTNRNALPEVWLAVEQAKQIETFLRCLSPTGNSLWSKFPMPNCNPSYVLDWCFVTAPPRLQVVAALMALGQWPADWQL